MLRGLGILLCILSTVGCSTGGMIQLGYLPVSQIEHKQMLKQSDYQEARKK